ncbi:MAG: cytochrome c3 family protein [Myxococcota bacterium]
MSNFRFPAWTNKIKHVAGAAGAGALVYAVVAVNYGFSPSATDVGYQPVQPVPFSHQLHSGQLGTDCRYCHNTVEVASHSPVPTTETCMGCHSMIHTKSEKLEPIRASWETGEAVPWVRIHDLPDYSYFNHSAHVNRGVGCKSCHGRIDTMEVVYQDQKLSMGWCLECHREPENHLRPQDRITDMDWAPENQVELGLQIKEARNINPPQSCSGCHR